MTNGPSAGAVPPRRVERLLRACLPIGAMGDSIVGDLHEEYVRDAVQLGCRQASRRYRRRAAGIVAYAIIDLVRLRPWTSAATPAAGRSPVATDGVLSHRVPLLGRADMGLIAAAFGVLGLGIVVNTALFAAVRPVPHVTPHPAGAMAALGLVSLLLALGTAAVAAVMLCVGPRWLRRRACRDAAVRRL